MISVQNFSAGYTQKSLFAHINFEIQKGNFLAIVGPNGAGKSTLLKGMLGFIPGKGKVCIDGKPLKKKRKSIAYVPQKHSVDWDFPATVFETILMGTYGNLGWLKRPGKKEKERVFEAMKTVKMTRYANTQIGELSGGQRQRVFLARALVQDAEILFLDEPFAGIDAVSEKLIFGVLKKQQTLGKTLFVVHHNLSHIEEYFSSVMFFNRAVIAHGKVSDTFTKENIQKTYGEGTFYCEGVTACALQDT